MLDAEILREDLGVIQAALGGILRWERNAPDILRAERFDGDDGGERGIDAATQAEHDRFESALMHVIPQTQHQRAIDGFLILHQLWTDEAGLRGVHH